MNPVVKLTSIERMVCGMVGLARNSSARDKGWSLHEPGRKDIGIETDVIGCYGEFAVARALDMNWNPIVGCLDTHRGDVGKIQVKTVLNKTDHLLIRQTDPADFLYVLCCLDNPITVRLVGWINGVDGKLEKYLRNGVSKPCFFVPQASLRAMDQIKYEIHPA